MNYEIIIYEVFFINFFMLILCNCNDYICNNYNDNLMHPHRKYLCMYLGFIEVPQFYKYLILFLFVKSHIHVSCSLIINIYIPMFSNNDKYIF